MVELTIEQKGYNIVAFEFEDVIQAADFMAKAIKQAKKKTTFTLKCEAGEEEVKADELI